MIKIKVAKNYISILGHANYDDYGKALFYIDEKNLEKAKSMYGNAPKWYLLPVFIALAIGVAYGCTLIAPWVMGLVG